MRLYFVQGSDKILLYWARSAYDLTQNQSQQHQHNIMLTKDQRHTKVHKSTGL